MSGLGILLSNSRVDCSKAKSIPPDHWNAVATHYRLRDRIYTRVRQISPLKFIYTGIHVSNLDRSIRFYTKELKMSLLFRAKIRETGGEVAWLKSKGSSQILELNWYPEKYPHGGSSGLDHLAFQVEDADQAYRELTRRSGGEIRPFDEGKWRLGYITDPDGNWVEIGSKTSKRKR